MIFANHFENGKNIRIFWAVHNIYLINKTEHIQTSKPRAEIINQQDFYSME